MWCVSTPRETARGVEPSHFSPETNHQSWTRESESDGGFHRRPSECHDQTETLSCRSEKFESHKLKWEEMSPDVVELRALVTHYWLYYWVVINSLLE